MLPCWAGRAMPNFKRPENLSFGQCVFSVLRKWAQASENMTYSFLSIAVIPSLNFDNCDTLSLTHTHTSILCYLCFEHYQTWIFYMLNNYSVRYFIINVNCNNIVYVLNIKPLCITLSKGMKLNVSSVIFCKILVS